MGVRDMKDNRDWKLNAEHRAFCGVPLRRTNRRREQHRHALPHSLAAGIAPLSPSYLDPPPSFERYRLRAKTPSWSSSQRRASRKS